MPGFCTLIPPSPHRQVLTNIWEKKQCDNSGLEHNTGYWILCVICFHPTNVMGILFRFSAAGGVIEFLTVKALKYIPSICVLRILTSLPHVRETLPRLSPSSCLLWQHYKTYTCTREEKARCVLRPQLRMITSSYQIFLNVQPSSYNPEGMEKTRTLSGVTSIVSFWITANFTHVHEERVRT
jgi:hypothetical protein